MAAVLSPGGQGGGQTDRHPLLMEQPLNRSIAEHVIDIGREGIASVSVRHRGNLDASVAPQAPVMTSSSSSPTASNSRNVLFTRTGDNYSRRRSPLNSGLWISIELVVNLSQITAAIISLSLSRHDHPKAPLFAWVVGYTVGCFATLPHLYWRYAHRYQGLEQDAPQLHQNSSQNNTPESTSYTAIVVNQALEERTNSTPLGSRFEQSLANSSPRVHAFVDHFKMALDCFFAVWFVVGNVWVFGGNSSAADAPHLYRLCIVFLTFSCIGYAMPFILCAMICCCLPCIISFLGFREDMSQNRGATSEEINALPTYKFKLKKSENGEIIDPESQSAGGILAIGTDKERTICAEDAECCICLAKYVDDDQIRELPCAHFFHTECVDKWLKINALCPLCKYEVGNNASSVSNDNPDHHQNDMRVENGSDQSSTGSTVPFVAAL